MGFNINGTVLPDFSACLELCASRNSQPANICMAVLWNVSNRSCFLKTANATISDLEPSNGSITAFADAAAFQDRPGQCPYANESTQVDQNGMEYQIYCETDEPADYFDVSGPGAQYKVHRADTLLDCLNFCSDGQPLCYGVS